MKMKKTLLVISMAVLSAVCARAQFSLSANDPASLRWNTLSGQKYKIVYPQGLDSLAFEYSSMLEWQNHFVGNSLGMAPGQFQKKPLPVVFHSLCALSNGVVTWAPRRMELVTIPQWHNPSAMPWIYDLTIHENRHAAQMQFGYKHVFKPFGWLFGEMFPGALAGLYPGKLLLEGDAVVAETGLSNDGRGRNASFLGYYYYSFDNGQWRNWMRWRLGSYYRYTPDHYAFGYLILSGIRTKYDAPLFMADYFDYVSRRPYNPYPFRTVLKKTSGKRFKESYPEILRYHYDTWAADTTARKPYMSWRPVTNSRIQTEYGNPNNTPDGKFLFVKEDIYHAPALVEIDSVGHERRLFGVSSAIDKINYDDTDSTLVWSEILKDPRWGQKQKSVIKTYDFKTKNVRQITRNGVLIYPAEFNKVCLAAIRYENSGGSTIVFVGKAGGDIIEEWKVPPFIQPVDLTTIDNTIYVAAVAEGGFGIWKLNKNADFTCSAEEILTPTPIQVGSLESDNGDLTFESDWDGTWEFFRMNLETKKLYRVTSSKHGGNDYSLCEDGSICWTKPSLNGNQVVYTSAAELVPKEINWEDHHHYPIAEKLSAQENELASKDTPSHQDIRESSRPTRKGASSAIVPKFHSWAPAWIDYDAVSAMSYENLPHLASPGIMGFFQNDLSTVGGYMGYQAKPEFDKNGNLSFRHGGHINLTYRGLYPVFEAKVDFNDRGKIEYRQVTQRDTVDNKVYKTTKIKPEQCSKPSVRFSLSTYIPWSWSSGGTLVGLIPNASITYSNDAYYDEYGTEHLGILLSAGLRAYVMQRTPSACVYPRWGIGGEAKYAGTLAYLYAYGYLPGIAGGGFKVTALSQTVVNPKSIFIGAHANMLPRGYVDFNGYLYGGKKFTIDYAAPFYMGDWNIGTAFYCTRGIITPHFDYSIPTYEKVGGLYSVGATLEFEFGAAFWIRTPMTFGLTYSYNSGPGYYPLIQEAKATTNPTILNHFRHYIGAVFNIELPN